jgi:glucosamine--fructose-6-phosphate aminotransferase (isomerizing)
MTDVGRIVREIQDGPDAIRATLDQAGPSAREAAAALRARNLRRLFVIGNGTSYHSSLACATLYRRHASPDDPVVIALTAGEFRTYPPALGNGDAVLGVSASGEFRDVVAVAEWLRGQVPFVGVAHVPDSSLARAAAHLVVSAGGPSEVPVMTKTFSATLVAAQLIVVGLLGAERLDRVVAQIREAADHAERAIAEAATVVPRLAEELVSAEHLFVVGSGLAHVAAMEAALKLKEMALVHAEATESWEMASGAATVVGPATVVVAIAPEGPGRAATQDVVRHAADWGARIVEVGPERMAPGSTLLELSPDAIEDHAPLTAVPPIALLADVLARARGIDPDHPGWVERYHSQGLTHIMGV